MNVVFLDFRPPDLLLQSIVNRVLLVGEEIRGLEIRFVGVRFHVKSPDSDSAFSVEAISWASGFKQQIPFCR